MRGTRGGMRGSRGGSSGNYNPNISVTGNDMNQGQNGPRPWRGMGRGRGGSNFQGPTRPGPPSDGLSQQPGGMMQPGGPVKRGPPVGPPGPKRGKLDKSRRVFRLMKDFYSKFLAITNLLNAFFYIFFC